MMVITMCRAAASAPGAELHLFQHAQNLGVGIVQKGSRVSVSPEKSLF